MAKSRSFSIYLLKQGFTPENCLKDDHKLEVISDVILPVEGKVYLYDFQPKQPWWKSYWNISKDLFQSQKGAMVFLKIEEKWFVLTFGPTYHNLKEIAYEYDFGIITTLNALNPKAIKSTDILMPETAKRQRVQSSKAAELNFFDLSDETILKKLTGAVREEYKELFKNITGGKNLRISSNQDPNGLVDLLKKLLTIYNSSEYKNNFSSIHNIVPIKDPTIIERLDEKLIEAFNQVPATMKLVLSVPDLVDYENDVVFKFYGAGKSDLEFEDVYIKGYRDYLESKKIAEIVNVEDFKKHSLHVCDGSGYTQKTYSIYNSFLFNCELDGKTYHLCEGEWYLIQDDFVQKMRNILDPLFIDTHDLLVNCNQKREDEYNSFIAQTNENIICLDKTNISPQGQTQIEPCDLVIFNNEKLELVHIKISTRSSSLSHLFNQGVNSIHAIRVEEESKKKFFELLNANGKSEWMELVNSNKIKVIYGIISKKTELKSDGLPIFSRISLMRAVNELKSRGIQVNIVFIYDEFQRKKIEDS